MRHWIFLENTSLYIKVFHRNYMTQFRKAGGVSINTNLRQSVLHVTQLLWVIFQRKS